MLLKNHWLNSGTAGDHHHHRNFCALLEIVDTTIVNVALNDMRGNLWVQP